MLNKFELILFSLLIALLFYTTINKIEFPEYKVVIDPGHGGLALSQKEIHGDRYDLLSDKYLSVYADGVSYKGVSEHIITYNIAKKVKKILDLTKSNKQFQKFKGIVKRFSNELFDRLIIDVKLSRKESLLNDDASHLKDPNADYRLFDYFDENGNILPGRISKINLFKPHLVVSLHCDMRAPIFFRGINPVISAPYSLLLKGLNYLSGLKTDRKFFFNSPYPDWFTESVRRTGFEWFLKDTAVYFTGFPITNSHKIVTNGFLGYRYNMVTWKYKDAHGWEKIARKHPPDSQYAVNAKDFILQGKFWEREQSVYESYRREGGDEGFGGDNLYASSEIIRYILYSLSISRNKYRYQKLGKPYISVWSLPILVNAITAYIELGYLKNRRDRYILTKKQDEIAEGIAVGIYSLFTGIKSKKIKKKYMPKGKKMNLKKYKLQYGESYFDAVSEH